jgi:hypothetical protein
MTVRGDYYARDKKGDRMCSVWSEEPILDHGEWVPARLTCGDQVYLPCSSSFAAKHVGRVLKPGEIVFVRLERGVDSHSQLLSSVARSLPVPMTIEPTLMTP